MATEKCYVYQGVIGRRDQLAGFMIEDLRTEFVRLIGRSFCTMAMADEGQAKEIPLATARPVHVLLGSWWYRHPRGGDLSRSRKDSVPYSPRSSADQQTDGPTLLEKRRAAGQQTDDGIFSWDPCGIWTDRPRVGADTTKIPAGHALVAPWRAGSLSPALRLPWPSCRSFFQSGGRISVRRSAVIPTAWCSLLPITP